MKNKLHFKMLKSLPEGVKHAGAVISAIIVIISAVVSLDAWIMDRAINHLKEQFEPMREQIKAIKLDTTRLQLLQMIEHKPDDKEGILKLARHYFVDLGGDWYATSIFNDWCIEKGIHVDWEMPI